MSPQLRALCEGHDGTQLRFDLVGMRVISNHMALLPSGAVESRGPTLMNAATRAFAKSMTWLCAIVFVAAAIDPSGQCIHDQMAGTLVVRRPSRYEHTHRISSRWVSV